MGPDGGLWLLRKDSPVSDDISWDNRNLVRISSASGASTIWTTSLAIAGTCMTIIDHPQTLSSSISSKAASAGVSAMLGLHAIQQLVEQDLDLLCPFDGELRKQD